MMAPISASHSRAADSTSALSTVWRSKVERLMTLSMSAVAVCCRSDSRSSLSRRAFSIAITACAAKLVTSSGGRLAVELLEGIIQRVLQHCAVSVIVFGRDEDEPVKLGQLRRVRALLVTPRCLTGVGMYSTALSH